MAERVGDLVARRSAAPPPLRPVELEHLGRRIGDERARPRSRPGGRSTGRCRRPARAPCRAARMRGARPGSRSACGRERIAFGHRRGVVVLAPPGHGSRRSARRAARGRGGHQRRSAGTPSVTAAATVAVASASAWLADQRAVGRRTAASPRSGWRQDDRHQASSPGRAPSAPSRRAGAACGWRPRSSTPRNADSSRIRISAGWSRAPEAWTRRTTPW